jgi:hypothetical protein
VRRLVRRTPPRSFGGGSAALDSTCFSAIF